ncbi:MAG TPA: hypothetical protein VKV17_01795 [Bryobacteraceae bacterium]|nr:hypothetical protein [Bryobacteraceae bacterium]
MSTCKATQQAVLRYTHADEHKRAGLLNRLPSAAGPGALKEISNFASQHPDVMKALDGLAAAIAPQHIARRH